jgi:hypothetical protein
MYGVKEEDDIGIKGYRLPKVAAALKPRASMISKAKPYGGMLDTVIKQKKLLPSPSQYKTEVSMLLLRHNAITSKSPRLTEGAMIELREKKQKRPGPGAHNIRFVDPRILGGKSDKGDRGSYLDDVQFKAKAVPGSI